MNKSYKTAAVLVTVATVRCVGQWPHLCCGGAGPGFPQRPGGCWWLTVPRTTNTADKQHTGSFTHTTLCSFTHTTLCCFTTHNTLQLHTHNTLQLHTQNTLQLHTHNTLQLHNTQHSAASHTQPISPATSHSNNNISTIHLLSTSHHNTPATLHNSNSNTFLPQR